MQCFGRQVFKKPARRFQRIVTIFVNTLSGHLASDPMVLENHLAGFFETLPLKVSRKYPV